jgi:hypothetical protein
MTVAAVRTSFLEQLVLLAVAAAVRQAEIPVAVAVGRTAVLLAVAVVAAAENLTKRHSETWNYPRCWKIPSRCLVLRHY